MIVVFDLDGTLIDSAPDIHAAANVVLGAEGFGPVTPAQSRGFIGNGARVFVERLERAAAGHNEPDRTDRMQARFLEVYETAHALNRPYRGVEPALRQMRAQGWRLGLCTNKPAGPARSVLAHLGWTDLFDTLVGGDTLPVIKPDPAPLRLALGTLGPGRAVFVGDSEVDGACAAAAGVPFALFTEGYRRGPVDAIPHTLSFTDWATFPGVAATIIA